MDFEFRAAGSELPHCCGAFYYWSVVTQLVTCFQYGVLE